MIFILLLTIGQLVSIGTIETTIPVSIILDGFTLESWKEQNVWNQTQIAIVRHLNELCKNDLQCNAEYGVNNIHLLNVIQYGLSSIHLNITADEPILNRTGDTPLYNYTSLLTGALFQAKIDIEHLHDNQLFDTVINSSIHSYSNSSLHRTGRFLYVLLGITIVAIVFALTIFSFQRIRQHHYSKLSRTAHTHNELFISSQSTAALHS